MFSEGSCDNEDCSSDAENSALPSHVLYIKKYFQIENRSQLLSGETRKCRNTLKSFNNPNRGITGQTETEMKHTIDDRDPSHPTNTN